MLLLASFYLAKRYVLCICVYMCNLGFLLYKYILINLTIYTHTQTQTQNIAYILD